MVIALTKANDLVDEINAKNLKWPGSQITSTLWKY